MGLVIIGHRSSKGTFGAYNFVFKGTRQCWWARATAHWVSRLFSTSVVVGSSHYSGGHGQTSTWCFHDSLYADNSYKHHWPFNKLLQRDLLWSNNNSQSDGKYNKSFWFTMIWLSSPQVMLVLTTMFVGVSNELPKTSYMKMVDYWLVFNLFIPFAEVLLHVYMVRKM